MLSSSSSSATNALFAGNLPVRPSTTRRVQQRQRRPSAGAYSISSLVPSAFGRPTGRAGRRVPHLSQDRQFNMDGGGSPPLDPEQSQCFPHEPIPTEPQPQRNPTTMSPGALPRVSFAGLQSRCGFRKTALVARPSMVAREKSVAINRFKKSKTRRFFHPYAKVGLDSASFQM